MPTGRELLTFAAVWLGLAVVVGVILLSFRRLIPGNQGSILPPQRHRAVGWGFAHLLIAVIICLGLQELIALAVGLPAADAVENQPNPERLAKILVVAAIAQPLQIATILIVCGFRFYQLGLTRHRLWLNLAGGYLLWLAITPGVQAIHWLVLWSQGTRPEMHTVQQLVEAAPTLQSWALILFAVLVAAPIAEELFFRGLLQSLLVSLPAAADAALLVSMGYAIFLGITSDWLWPVLFLVTVPPGYLAFEFATRRLLPRPGAARAIYVSSLLFAGMHAPVWPTPIPLFFLGLGLGFLAYRTQSVVGTILAHILFNSVASFQLMLR